MEAQNLIAAGYLARREARPGDARQALRMAEQTADRMLLAQALTGAGQIARDLGDYEVAQQDYESAVAVLGTVDDPLRLAHTIRHVGDILQQRGRPNSALACYHEALALYHANPAVKALDLANTLAGFARALDDLGQTEATGLWREARDPYASVHVQAGVDEANRCLS